MKIQPLSTQPRDNVCKSNLFGLRWDLWGGRITLGKLLQLLEAVSRNQESSPDFLSAWEIGGFVLEMY